MSLLGEFTDNNKRKIVLSRDNCSLISSAKRFALDCQPMENQSHSQTESSKIDTELVEVPNLIIFEETKEKPKSVIKLDDLRRIARSSVENSSVEQLNDPHGKKKKNKK
jgi:hypothetical protein